MSYIKIIGSDNFPIAEMSEDEYTPEENADKADFQFDMMRDLKAEEHSE